ncbi:MAG: sirohydrochlorin nickelochelatase [Methanobacterium sp.]|nr:sirohydrochlorin nickelochelatase [Methanobacterium sp.]
MDTNSNSKNNIGVLLISHGSRLPYGEDVINKIAEIYREKTDYPVIVSYMNMSKPTIPTAINQLAESGVEKIIAIPVFLAHGVHTTQDIPNILGIDNGHDLKEQSSTGNEHHHGHGHSHHEEETEEISFKGEIIYTEPLGADRRIADIIEDRVNDAL